VQVEENAVSSRPPVVHRDGRGVKSRYLRIICRNLVGDPFVFIRLMKRIRSTSCCRTSDRSFCRVWFDPSKKNDTEQSRSVAARKRRLAENAGVALLVFLTAWKDTPIPGANSAC